MASACAFGRPCSRAWSPRSATPSRRSSWASRSDQRERLNVEARHSPGLVRPRRHQSQRPGRGRHGALGYCRQGGGALALRPARRRRAQPRAGDGEPRPLQRRRQGHGAHRAGAGRQGRRGQGPRVRPRCHRSGAQGRGPADPVRGRLQQRPHDGRRPGPASRAGRRSISCSWKIRPGRRKPCSSRRRFPGSRSAWAPISARPSSSRSMPGRLPSASCSPTSA